jgi:hypothetical protein
MASEIAHPSDPWSLGLAVMMSLPALVDIDGEGVMAAPKVCMIDLL